MMKMKKRKGVHPSYLFFKKEKKHKIKKDILDVCIIFF